MKKLLISWVSRCYIVWHVLTLTDKFPCFTVQSKCLWFSASFCRSHWHKRHHTSRNCDFITKRLSGSVRYTKKMKLSSFASVATSMVARVLSTLAGKIFLRQSICIPWLNYQVYFLSVFFFPLVREIYIWGIIVLWSTENNNVSVIIRINFHVP